MDENLWDIVFWSIRCCQVAAQTVQEVSDAMVQIITHDVTAFLRFWKRSDELKLNLSEKLT